MIDVKVEFNEEMLKALNSLPFLVQQKVADKCLAAMAKPIVAKARAIAPSSETSGSRMHWSKKYSQNPGYQNHSAKAIGSKTFKGQNGCTLFVGGEYPLGNKLQFSFAISKKGIPTERREKFWGREGGTYRPKERFLERAADETRDQQETAFANALDKALQ